MPQSHSQLHTLLDVTPKIDHFPPDGGYEEIGHLLLGAVITRHDYDELSLVSRWRRAEDGAGYQVRVGKLGDQRVKFACDLAC